MQITDCKSRKVQLVLFQPLTTELMYDTAYLGQRRGPRNELDLALPGQATIAQFALDSGLVGICR
jgi:hypothetical protein